MTTASVAFPSATSTMYSIGFSGNGCADLLRAATLYRWQVQGAQDKTYAVRCSVDLIPAGGVYFTIDWHDAVNGTVTQANARSAPNVALTDSYQSIQGSPAYDALAAMTPDEALVISMAIALLWAGAWGVRAIKSAIFTTERDADENF